MATRQKAVDIPKIRRPTTPEEDENELIGLAIDLARKQLRSGSASPSTINHYLKLASKREDLERKVLEQKVELMTAQTENIKAAQRTEELYSEALKAMRLYSGMELVEGGFYD